MDDLGFDRLTLRLAGSTLLDRRRVGRTLALLGLGAGLSRVAGAETKRKRKKKRRKKAGCTPDCAGKACGADDGCGDSCKTGSCPANQSCQGGQCVPGSTCGPADCGSPGDYNDLILVHGRRECKARGFGYNENSGPVGICERNANRGAFCAPCCGGARDIDERCGPADSGYVCVSDEGPFGVCDCPPGTQRCPFSTRCYSHPNECCPSGGVNGNFSPCGTGQRCCNGVCTGGCAPGFGGCNFYPCDDDCNPCTQDAPLCCGLGAPTYGTVCVAAQFCPAS